MEENKTIREDVEGISKKLDELIEQKKVKKFKMPYSAKLGKSKIKKGYVIVQYINENREVTFFKKPIEEGTIMHNETPHLANAKCMLSYKGKPMLIVPSWSIEPFSPQQNMDDAERLKSLSIGYRYVFNRMKNSLISAKKKMSWAVVIGGIAVIILLGYLISTGGLKNFKLF